MDTNVTLDTEGQHMMLGWLFGDDNRTVDEMGAALESHIIETPAVVELSPMSALIAQWEAAKVRNVVVYNQADELCAPYVCIGGYVWNTPPAVETLYEMLSSLNFPPHPVGKTFNYSKTERGIRAWARYTAKLEKAIVEAQKAIEEMGE